MIRHQRAYNLLKTLCSTETGRASANDEDVDVAGVKVSV